MKKIPIGTFEFSTCYECKESSYGESKYLDIGLKHGGGVTQGYPAFRVPDIDVAKKYLCEIFEISNIEQLKGKELWSIGEYTSIVALVNPKNKKVFSLFSHYQIMEYIDDIAEFKKQPEYKSINLNHEDFFNLIIVTECAKKLKNDVKGTEVINWVKSNLLYLSLDNSLEKKSDFQIKVKI